MGNLRNGDKMSQQKPTISRARLLSRLEELGAIGRHPQGGLRRLAANDADREARDLLVSWMKQLHLDVRVDRIGNIFGIRKGTTHGPAVMTGSHIDTVFDGGLYDGALGVLAGLELVETLNDGAIETSRPIAIAAFTNEEGVRFQPDMMGSLVTAGGMPLEDALNTRDNEGKILGDELKRISYAGDMECGSIVPHAFVELHIEQGPVLERDGMSIGAVNALQGISWTEVKFHGQANHAGTTPMSLRRDAGYSAAMLTCRVREIAREIGNGQVATVGKLQLDPGDINVVPGSATMTVDLRNADNDLLEQAESKLQTAIDEIASAENVKAECRKLARFPPVQFEANIVERIEEEARNFGFSFKRMTSGAGHDAQMMARICPSAMIFVPSRDGISHNPAEHTDQDHLENGANVLLRTIIGLANS